MTASPASPAPAPMVGNALDAVGGLLASFGLTRTATRTTVEEAVAAEVTARGLAASVHSLRYRELVLAARPQDAALLRLDADAILEALNAVLDEPVDRLRVRVTH